MPTAQATRARRYMWRAGQTSWMWQTLCLTPMWCVSSVSVAGVDSEYVYTQVFCACPVRKYAGNLSNFINRPCCFPPLLPCAVVSLCVCVCVRAHVNFMQGGGVGGAVACTTTRCLFSNVTFTNNTADQLGGALWTSSASGTEVNNSRIVGNKVGK